MANQNDFDTFLFAILFRNVLIKHRQATYLLKSVDKFLKRQILETCQINYKNRINVR